MLKPTVGIMSSLNWPDCRQGDSRVRAVLGDPHLGTRLSESEGSAPVRGRQFRNQGDLFAYSLSAENGNAVRLQRKTYSPPRLRTCSQSESEVELQGFFVVSVYMILTIAIEIQ